MTKLKFLFDEEEEKEELKPGWAQRTRGIGKLPEYEIGKVGLEKAKDIEIPKSTKLKFTADVGVGVGAKTEMGVTFPEEPKPLIKGLPKSLPSDKPKELFQDPKMEEIHKINFESFQLWFKELKESKDKVAFLKGEGQSPELTGLRKQYNELAPYMFAKSEQWISNVSIIAVGVGMAQQLVSAAVTSGFKVKDKVFSAKELKEVLGRARAAYDFETGKFKATLSDNDFTVMKQLNVFLKTTGKSPAAREMLEKIVEKTGGLSFPQQVNIFGGTLRMGVSPEDIVKSFTLTRQLTQEMIQGLDPVKVSQVTQALLNTSPALASEFLKAVEKPEIIPKVEIKKDDFLIDKSKEMIKTLREQRMGTGVEYLPEKEIGVFKEWLVRVKDKVTPYLNKEENIYLDSLKAEAKPPTIEAKPTEEIEAVKKAVVAEPTPKAIPKELEPLAEEARKAKDVDEFIDKNIDNYAKTTPEYKQWAKGSKNIIEAYHGTPYNFDEFKTQSESGKQAGAYELEGISFASKKENAEPFSRQYSDSYHTEKEQLDKKYPNVSEIKDKINKIEKGKKLRSLEKIEQEFNTYKDMLSKEWEEKKEWVYHNDYKRFQKNEERLFKITDDLKNEYKRAKDYIPPTVTQKELDLVKEYDKKLKDIEDKTPSNIYKVYIKGKKIIDEIGEEIGFSGTRDSIVAELNGDILRIKDADTGQYIGEEIIVNDPKQIFIVNSPKTKQQLTSFYSQATAKPTTEGKAEVGEAAVNIDDLQKKYGSDVEFIRGTSKRLLGGKLQVDVRFPNEIDKNYTHELGHNVYDYTLWDNRIQKEFDNLSKSEYSKLSEKQKQHGNFAITNNPEQDFAETFSHWFSKPIEGHKTLHDLPQSYQNFMRKYFGEPKLIKSPTPPVAEKAITEAPAPEIELASPAQINKSYAIAKSKAMVSEEGKLKPQYRKIAEVFTGKKYIEKMTPEEAEMFIDQLNRLPEPKLKQGKLVAPSIPRTMKLTTEGFFQKKYGEPTPIWLLRDQTYYATQLGIHPLVEPFEKGKQEFDLEFRKSSNLVDRMVNKLNQIAKTSMGDRIKSKVKNVPTKAESKMAELINKHETTPTGLSEKEADVFKYFRNLSKDIWRRENEVREKVDLPPIKYKTAYFRHTADAMAKEMLEGKYPFPQGIKYWSEKMVGKKIFNPMEFHRKLSDDLIDIWSKDIRAVTKSMLWNGLKEIYLAQPAKFLSEQLNAISKDLPEYKNLSPRDQAAYDQTKVIPSSTKKWLIDYINQVLKGQETELDASLNRIVTKSGLKGIFDKVLSPFGRSIGRKPITNTFMLGGRAIISGVMGWVPRQITRNSFQPVQNLALYGVKATIKAFLPASVDKNLKELMSESLFLKSYTGFEELPTNLMAKLEKVWLGPYGIVAVNNAKLGMKAAYWNILELIKNPKFKKHGWADPQRTKDTPKGFLYPSEKEKLLREMEFGASATQYQYIPMGMPGVFRYKALVPLTRLQSWWMNYFTKFLREATYRAFKGRPSWAGEDGPTLPWSRRVNFLKYLIIGGAILTSLGYERSFLLGVAPTYLSPAGQLALGFYNYVTADADEDWKRKRALNQIYYAWKAFIPGSLAWRDFLAVWKGEKELEEILFYGKKEEKKVQPPLKITIPKGGKLKFTKPEIKKSTKLKFNF